MGLFEGIKLPFNGPLISHLFYADDALFVGKYSNTNILNLSRILNCFERASGLKINFKKSIVSGVGIDNSLIASIGRLLRCRVGTTAFTYLGIPVGVSMNLIKSWKPLVDKVAKRLNTWYEKSLSMGGRITLIK